PLFEAMSSLGRIRLLDFIGSASTLLLFLDPLDHASLDAEVVRVRRDLRTLDRLQVKVLAVLADDLNGCRIFAAAHLLDFPVISDDDGRLRRLYGAKGTTAFLISPDARIAAVRSAPLDMEHIRTTARRLSA
ncbi:MAG TPA: redoxin domain-containing protein, partial [Verrucomicrobiae bacterium]|nr:redoxin domain-containing protein [Verrucomicrobiae bacterium]